MRINNNISALNAFNALTINNNKFTKVIRQLSTGMRINSASDDAAGLAISETIRSKVSGLNRAMQNAQDGISLLQTAEGALGETNSMVQRMRELAVQAANDTLTSQDRSYLQMEIDALKDQIDSIARNTQFNTKSLLDGSLCGTWTSTDTTTKAYIRGSLETEGNFRIEIKADPGSAQVQKSNIFKIKHENVVTNLQLNSADGFEGLSIDGLPAGDYAISTSMGAGGEVTYIHEATLEGSATQDNDSGMSETMTLTFTSEDGDTASMEINLDPTSHKDTSDEGAEGKKQIAQDIVKKINETGTITVNDNEITLKAELTGDGTSYTIKATGKEHITSMSSSVSLNPLSDRIESTSDNSETVTWDAIRVTGTSTVEGTVSIYKNDGTLLGEVSVESKQSSSTIAGNIASKLNELDYDDVFITTESGYSYIWMGKSDNVDFYITTSAIGGSLNVDQFANGRQITKNGYDINESITFKAPGCEANEQIKLTLGGSTIATVTTTEATSETEIPELIRKELCRDTGNEFRFPSSSTSRQVTLVFTDNGDGSFSIKSKEAKDIWTGNLNLGCTFTIAGATPSGEASASENTDEYNQIPQTEADGLAVLTGTYGVNADDAFSVKLEGANGKVQNNASVLFEVTGAAYDTESKMGTVTLSAISNVLGVDGTDRTYTNQKIVISTNHTSVNLGSLLGEDDDHFVLELKDGFDISQFETGSKFVYNICGVGDPANTTADTSIFISGKQDSSWPSQWDEDNGSYVTNNNNKIQYNLNAAAVSNSDVHFRNFYLNSDTGKVYNGDVKLTVNNDFQTASKNFTANPEPAAAFTANYVGKIATGDTKLRDIEQFWNSSGVFMLEEPQTITISQNDGKRAQITLNESDTLNDVKNKLNDAIANGLGQGLYVKGGNANNFVTFVENSTGNNGLETVKGTFLIRSVIPGSKGELTFSSTYGSLIDSLGLNTVHESKDTSYTASVYNAHDNTLIARDIKTSDNMLKGVIDKNVDVEFSAMSAVSAVWSDSDRNFILTPDSEYYVTNLHLAKNDLNFQTGADEGDYVTLDIGNMSSEALGIKGVNVMTFERASKAITTLDNAVRYISSQRTKIGSYQNALEYAIENLTVTGTNLTSSDSRIRDTDMAKTMMEFVKFQIINQSGTSMLSQANQTARTVLNLLQ